MDDVKECLGDKKDPDRGGAVGSTCGQLRQQQDINVGAHNVTFSTYKLDMVVVVLFPSITTEPDSHHCRFATFFYLVKLL